MRNFIIAILLLVSPCLYAQNQPTFEQAWQAAQNGDANAYYWLGCFYYQGEGTKQNYTEALKYFQKAANNGDAYSYAWIAKIYLKSASNLNGNLNGSKELEHYASG